MEQFQFPFQQSLKNQLTAQMQQVVTAAEAATEQAYAPYSRFKVGAAVLLEDGKILMGANHENASYPAGICAERAALATVNMNDEHPKVKAIAVTYKGEGANETPLSPCGICRQTILEVQQWQGTPIAVYMCSPNGNIIYVEDASSLLPFYFGSEALAEATPPVNSPF